MKDFNLVDLLVLIKKIQMPVGANYLSKQTGVPPATIGRMLKDAEDKGYLSGVSNKGRCITQMGSAYLDEVNTAKLIQNSAAKLLNYTMNVSTQSLLNVLEVRKLLEPHSVVLACQNAKGKDLKALDELLYEHSFETRHGHSGAEADLAIHLLIAKCSGNDVIYHLMNLLLTENNIYTLFSSVTSALNLSELTKHDALITAIQNRDPIQAKLAMEDHLECLIRCVKSYPDISVCDHTNK